MTHERILLTVVWLVLCVTGHEVGAGLLLLAWVCLWALDEVESR